METNWYEEIRSILKENMTDKGFEFWDKLDSKIPNVWDRPTSSTGKYHQTEDGRVPVQAEHICLMLNTAVRLYKMFDITPKTSDADMLALAVVLHDSFKFGEDGKGKYTHKKHDTIIADKIVDKKDWFMSILDEDQCHILQEAVRFHSGRWSNEATPEYDSNKLSKYSQFVHTLDMLDTANLLKYYKGR